MPHSRMKCRSAFQYRLMSDENILLKPVREPSLDEFYSLIEKAQETAKKIGLTEEDINAVIRERSGNENRCLCCCRKSGISVIFYWFQTGISVNLR